MKKRTLSLLLAVLMLALSLVQTACKKTPATEAPAAQAPSNAAADGEAFVFPEGETDFAALRTPGSQEAAFGYRTFFLPAPNNGTQPFIGDTMPYYENGVYYVYYLKEGGDSYNHSIYLVTTRDFVEYTEKEDVVLEASRSGGQDGWIGTGSVVKVKDVYYLFYTGHAFSDAYEFKEKIMVAKGTDPTSFEKVAGWEIVPPSELGQKNDFRDPQAYYDEASDTIVMTVTASQGGKARILKYTLSSDLAQVAYDGVIFTDPTGSFWNLECSDTFRIGEKYYLTYSGQDDTLWYAVSDEPYGPYGEAVRLDAKLFYAAKHVENGADAYMVGWARRSESVSSTQDVTGWAGNLAVQKLVQNEDGSLALAPVDAVLAQFTDRRQLLVEGMTAELSAGSAYGYLDLCTVFESFLLTGRIRFEKSGTFGLAFDYNGRADKYKFITFDPAAGTLSLQFNEGNTPITETAVRLEAGKDYAFTYIQEGSVGIFYLDGLAALTVRLYGVAGRPVRLFAENNSVAVSDLRQYTR